MTRTLENTRFMFESATEVRKDWSLFFDKAVREKPVFIKRTRDSAILADLRFVSLLLEQYTFECEKYVEEDGSITLSLDVPDIVENAATEQEAKIELAKSILDYAKDFYEDYDYWSSAPNRKGHVPYVFKALLLNDTSKIGELVQCRVGKN